MGKYKWIRRIVPVLAALIFVAGLRAQNLSVIDALEKKIAAGREDTSKANDLLSLASNLNASDFKRTLRISQEALELSTKLHYARGIAGAYNAFADAYWNHADFVEAQNYYFKAYRFNDSIHDKRGVALALYNIGWILTVQQKDYKEDGYLYRALAIFQELKDTSDLLNIYNALGSAHGHHFREDPKKNSAYLDSAQKYFSAGEKLDILNKYPAKIGRMYGNMAGLYSETGDYQNALHYIDLSRKILLSTNDTASYMMCDIMRGSFLTELKSYKEALDVFTNVHDYAARHDLKHIEAPALQGMAFAHYYLGKYKDAYIEMDEFVTLTNKLNKEAYATDVKDLQGKYDLEKAETNVKELKQANEIQELKNRQSRYFNFILLAVALAVIIVAVLLFRQNKLKNEANEKLKEQNQIIYEKKKEIDHSINYARGIQNAVLPAVSDLKKYFPESFVLYLPKDVVSGDFYWFSEVESLEIGVRREGENQNVSFDLESSGDSDTLSHQQSEQSVPNTGLQTNSELRTKNSQLLLAAADCTGHGVPGALMSIVSMDKLNHAVFEKKLSGPSAILQYLNIEVKKALKQHNDESRQKDGLDIALLNIDRARLKALYAGANRPLYLVRNGELKEYKADKVAIAGFTPNEHVFAQQEIDLQPGDCLYLFSDGYSDQFGGPEGKKFMTRSLKGLLESMSDKPMSEQERLAAESHQQWRGNYEQVDDILLIGIKI